MLGPEHASVAITLANIGELHLKAGSWAQAAQAFERALAIDEIALGPDHIALAYDLSGLGHALTRLGKPARAVPLLERAVKLRDVEGYDPFQLADARFRLAEALWATPAGDRARAIRLAEQAREGFASDPAAGDEVAKVDAWLKPRRRSR